MADIIFIDPSEKPPQDHHHFVLPVLTYKNIIAVVSGQN